MRTESAKIIAELVSTLNGITVLGSPVSAYPNPPPQSKRYIWVQQPDEVQDDPKDRSHARGVIAISIVDRTKDDYGSREWIEAALVEVLANIKTSPGSTLPGVSELVLWHVLDTDSFVTEDRDGQALIKNIRVEYLTEVFY